jgi:hypothetical protein
LVLCIPKVYIIAYFLKLLNNYLNGLNLKSQIDALALECHI